jgi:hypothetical protein
MYTNSIHLYKGEDMSLFTMGLIAGVTLTMFARAGFDLMWMALSPAPARRK